MAHPIGAPMWTSVEQKCACQVSNAGRALASGRVAAAAGNPAGACIDFILAEVLLTDAGHPRAAAAVRNERRNLPRSPG